MGERVKFADSPRHPMVLCLVAALCLQGEASFGEETPETKVLQEVLHVIETRRERMNPLWVRYEVHRIVTPAWQKGARGGREDSHSEAEYACKGTKTRSWVAPGNSGAGRQEDFIIFNGEVQIQPSNKENEYILSKAPSVKRTAPSPLSITGADGFFQSLKSWQAGKTKIAGLSVTRGQDKDDEPLAVVEIRYGTGWRNKAWLLPDRGYALRRIEVYNAKDEFVDRSQVLEFMTVNGLIYPKRGQSEHFLAGGKLGFTETFQVSRLETEAGKIPDSLFRFDVPEGASVWDDDLKVMVRNTELTQSHLNEVLLRLGTPQSLWKKWWFLGGTTVGVALFGYVGLRWWRRRKGNRGPAKAG